MQVKSPPKLVFYPIRSAFFSNESKFVRNYFDIRERSIIEIDTLEPNFEPENHNDQPKET
jgi:hypothetical protein